MLSANRIAALLLFFTFMFSAVTALHAQSAEKGRTAMSLQLSSTAFTPGARIPKDFTADGKNQSPPLKWSAVPAGTKSLALICDDPDAPGGTWVHWVIFDIPPSLQELEQGVANQSSITNGAKQGTNSFHKIGYGGPSPPPGKAHRYFFKLFALDTTLNLDAAADAKKLDIAMKGHVLGEGQLMGQYAR
jgi:Raf kinase inhibitor-like YbhB/YbcL family protein